MKTLIRNMVTQQSLMALARRLLILTPLFVMPSFIQADDTEIYFATPPAGASTVKDRPNVVFMMDTSGSMKSQIQGTPPPYDSTFDYGASDDNLVFVYRNNRGVVGDAVLVNGDFARGQVMINKTSLAVNCPAGLAAINNAARPYYFDKAVYESPGNVYELDINVDMDPTETIWCESNDSGNKPSTGSSCNGWNHRSCNDEIVFVSANYHDWFQGVGKKRDLMVKTAKTMVDTFTDLNMGIMRFMATGQGGFVLQDMLDTTTAANRQVLKDSFDKLPHNGGTPLEEAMWEAFLYFDSRAVDYGLASSERDTNAETGANYNSPIVGSCQKNHLIYLTDGKPTGDNDAFGKIQAEIGATCSGEAFGVSGNCLDDLAGYMYGHDFQTGTGWDGLQNVVTHTIGFDLNGYQVVIDYLDKVAKAGGDSHGVYEANSAVALTQAFNEILTGIAEGTTSFTAPAVAAGSYNRLESDSALFYALFAPENSPRWSGNVKHYKIGLEDGVVGQNIPVVSAVTADGFFKDDSHSFWSDTVDGAEIDIGGVAGELKTPVTRKVLTDLDGAGPNVMIPIDDSAVVFGDVGAADDAERLLIMEWARGAVAGDPTNSLFFQSDILHSRPVVVIYDEGTTSEKKVLYVGDNDGYFHGFDAADGSEFFGFMPKELLPNLKTYFDNAGDHTDRIYGMDGEITVWHSKNFAPTLLSPPQPPTTNHVYVYATMRRGGNSIYALDMTDYNNPDLIWQIDGGAGSFSRLGETWSKPVHKNVMWNGTKTDVLFFGGGYDADYDSSPLAAGAHKGNALYMVDATTGGLLWSATYDAATRPEMLHSFVSQLSFLDKNKDGNTDAFFAVDLVGQVWRFDFDEGNSGAADFVADSGRIAHLGDYDAGLNASVFRRFYTGLSVSRVTSSAVGGTLLSISVGSGYRAHPLDTAVEDRIYTMFDRNVFAVPVTYQYASGPGLITEASLENAKNYNLLTGISQHGWYRELLIGGEKILSNPLTTGGAVITSAYVPQSGGQCVAATGENSLYALNVLTGQSILSSGSDSLSLGLSGIAPQPVLIQLIKTVKRYLYDENGNPILDANGDHAYVNEEYLETVIVIGTKVIGTTGGSVAGVTVDLLDNDVVFDYWREL